MALTYIGDNIADLRKSLNLSQEELAEKLNVSRQAISKWERNESYPETENLIALSKLFNVSIDDLINKPLENANAGESLENNSTDLAENSNQTDKNACENSNIAPLNCKACDRDEDEDDEEDDDEADRLNKERFPFWANLPYPIVVTIAFLLWGFIAPNGFSLSWTLFITIPVYYSLLTAIRTKRLSSFAYPVFAAFIYCLFGMTFSIWHPLWLIFLTIPVYYCIANAIDRAISR